MKFILITILFLSVNVYAQNTPIIKCKVENKNWQATIILDGIGAGFMNFKKLPENKNYTCSLKLSYFNDGQKSITPTITATFDRGACEPDLGSLSGQILDYLTLNINTSNKSNPHGRLQWLRRTQPDECKVEKLNLFDVSLNSKKWQEGKWGRNIANDPKK